MTFSHPTSYAWLSIFTAVCTITLKTAAYFLTGSVGLLSDALESVVNLVAAILALAMLRLAARPPDEEHAYGHTKAEYFSSGVEGALILMAAASIAYTSIERLSNPQPLRQLNQGLLISVLASAVNFAVAMVLLRAGRRLQSITLEADGQHLMTDVWTSLGVMLGLGAVWLTGWTMLDALVALLVAANIVWTGITLMRRSALGLMDTALAPDERQNIQTILEEYKRSGIQFHALRTRQSAARRFMSVHVLVPGRWSVQEGHDLLEAIEQRIRAVLPGITVFTHLEPLEDPLSLDDVAIDRVDEKGRGDA